MNMETECIEPAADDVSTDINIEKNENGKKKEPVYNKENTTIFGARDEDYLAEPKKNNIRRISDEFKISASGALGTGKDGIKKAASGLSSGLRTVTNRIPIPKSPKAFRRRSWHAYDELEDDEEEQFIPEKDSVSDDDRKSKKVKDQKSKVKSDSKEKTKKDKKDKTKIKKNTKGKIDWCSGDGLTDVNNSEKEGEVDLNDKNDEQILFEPLETVGLMSKVTISVHEAD